MGQIKREEIGTLDLLHVLTLTAPKPWICEGLCESEGRQHEGEIRPVRISGYPMVGYTPFLYCKGAMKREVEHGLIVEEFTWPD